MLGKQGFASGRPEVPVAPKVVVAGSPEPVGKVVLVSDFVAEVEAGVEHEAAARPAVHWGYAL